MPHSPTIGYNAFIEMCELLKVTGDFSVKPLSASRALISGIPNASFNYAFDLNETRLASVEQDLKTLREVRVPILILIPETKAPYFESLLQRYNISLVNTSQGKVFDLTAPMNYTPREDIQIREVYSLDDLNVWSEINACAFAYFPQSEIPFFYKILDMPTDKRPMRLFTAYYQGKPAGACLVSFENDHITSCNAWTGVFPEFRNKGIMTEMVQYRMQLSKDLGYKRSVVQCLVSSRGVYDRLNFQSTDMIHLYLIHP